MYFLLISVRVAVTYVYLHAPREERWRIRGQDNATWRWQVNFYRELIRPWGGRVSQMARIHAWEGYVPVSVYGCQQVNSRSPLNWFEL